MSNVGQPERKTQDRVIELFRDSLGYDYLGNWEYRAANSNIDVGLLTQNLRARGYSDNLINKAIDKLKSDASLGSSRDLYEANRDVYGLLRYGVKVKPGVGEQTETVWLVDWARPEVNHFALAEEVTVLGQHTKRPDIVLYVNGIAFGTIELKRSKVAVSEGIRQSIGNQRPEFIRPFFTTVQFVMAGNDVEGLRYSAIDTPEKYWLAWREPSDIADPLDRSLTQLCSKERLLELVHDFMVFDAGQKKTSRHNQYFGVKAAQERIAKREGGIIWHTQGSGKSLTMVWLAKWIRENQPDARVLLITDRTELDDQIEKVFQGVNESIYRTKSGGDLLATLNVSEEWLVCSLVHKFRGSEDEAARDAAESEFIRELKATIPKDFHAKGNIFVFVDEAHRTQSGKMHDAMKALMPGAMFIGFTGTPLLKEDKATTEERFGSFIHTYQFDEGVADGVVLDLRYEARNIDQDLTSPAKVDQWFEAKTRGMTDLSRAELKKRWGTMQKVVSSEPRARQIVNDILLDMEIKPRLSNGRGNAILVSQSIYQACKFYELFTQAGFKGKCAIITSYTPQASDISKEDSGHGATERLRQYEIYRQMLADHFNEPADKAMGKVEQFEKDVKERFVNDPGQMRLLIVVDKLLTGFDAPSATYLYIDKKMQDHGLFQAICRVNRLDGEDKDYGYIVDYRDLFNSLESAITDYTGGALEGYETKDIEGLLSDRIDKARDDLDEALEKIRALCEPVAPPKDTLQYQQYFCAREQGNAEQLKANEPKRVELYKSVAAVTRAYGNLANDMQAAGYSDAEATAIKDEIAHYANVRDEVKLGAGEDVDFKQYEAGMRHLLDTYISAKPSEVVSDFQEAGLIQLIVEMGAGALDKLPAGIKKDPEAMAETIANNMRKVIIDERPMNPKYYDKMSELLDAILEERRQGALDYKEYLEKLLEHASNLGKGESDTEYPEWADNGARRALIDFFDQAPELAAVVDTTILHTKPDSWVGNAMKEKKVKRALAQTLPADFDRLDELLELLKARHEYR
ncbi:putative type I restriction enzyme [Streptomyces scabiei 87.22]|uniref:Type I restriction enzyme endonuclease subunit n=1 Tax=Streptomyces scabiei (strain 87.22) TaxID=680198 RepID=C9Z8J5_STRSW|nr:MULTISPECIES: type I restriction endonuclease subunit R [Streptomyces]MBP5867925.1 type I restriction endonuclease subunit R [Streptomyces sp. LBUM 1485]MBP5916265.1 type I restriction endonuclease subunit R [Streptomyces sp. LBUM 1486]MDX2540138.1 type I restriction endonuclease subunit R [Streptomyces scabiei]MDX2802555.1 type I restriction endonuclease subunit R [Streptomyces scabiei]MDX2856842.1 type I restriction endonuclease subunit R [Streptomyces scabiei]